MGSIRHWSKNTQRQCVSALALVLFGLAIATLYLQTIQLYTLNTVTIPVEQIGSTHTLFASSSKPMQLSIPSVGITASFEESLGLTDTDAVEVPKAYNTVGWYKYGPTPGELGPSVVLGHVDSVDGPAVFFSLGQVAEGDEVLIKREDDTTVVFEVTGFERIAQNEFPTERVYGKVPYAGIRLITCTGIYSKGEQRYSHNLIVYGTLKEIQHTETEDIDGL